MPPLPKRTGIEERAFMNWARMAILSASSHPLLFLIDPSTKDWRSNLGSRDHRSSNEDDPAVQAGHLYTRWALSDIKDQRFALEDADQNLEANYSGERRGVIFDRPAVDIGGVPAMLASVQMWERLDLLTPKGMRTPHPGWGYI
jgi:Bacterial toxin 5